MQIVASQTYNRSGNYINNSRNFSNNCLKPNELAAKLADKYYRQLNQFPTSENKFKIGFEPFVAFTETVAALALVWCFRSIATVINLITTFGAFGQAFVAGIDPEKKANGKNGNHKLNGHTNSQPAFTSNEREVREEIENKEAGMAWFQFFAGGGGLLGILWEYLSGKEDDANEVSTAKKIALSASSGLNAFFMLASSFEEALASMFSWNGGGKKGKGQDFRSMQINRDNNLRCTVEWGLMSVVPWVANIGVLKRFVDFAVVYGTIREGLEYFRDTKRINLTMNGRRFLDIDLNKKPILKGLIEFFVNPLSVFKKGSGVENGDRYKLRWPFTGMLKWLVGTENDTGGKGISGFRNRFVAPLLRNVFGCQPFSTYLDNSDNIICEFTEEPGVEPKPLTPHEKVVSHRTERIQSRIPDREAFASVAVN